MAFAQFGVINFLLITYNVYCGYGNNRTSRYYQRMMSYYEQPCKKHLDNSSLLLQGLTTLIRRLEWKSYAVVYENTSEAVNNCYLGRMDPDTNTSLILSYQIKGANSTQELRDLHSVLYPHINILMCCSYFNSGLLKLAETMDVESNRTMDFRHHSRWLVLHLHHNDGVFLSPRKLKNIAVVMKRSSACAKESVTGFRGVQVYTESDGVESTSVSALSADLIFPNLKYGYNNSTIKVSLRPYPPYAYRVTSNGTRRYRGYSIDIVDALAKALNFSYEIVEPVDQEWGEFIDGAWNGLVGQLQRREVDLTASDLTIHHERAKVMDFILPQIQTERVDIIYRKVEDLHSHWTMLFDFINPMVFLLIVACIFIFPLLYVFVETAQFLDGEVTLRHVMKRKPLCGRTEMLWFTVGSILKQGGSESPRSCANRILLSFWWLFVIVLTSTYSAHFIANLSVKREEKPFSSLRELLTNRQYKIGSTLSGISSELLQESTRGDVRMLFERLKGRNDTPESSPEFDVHLNIMKSRTYAVVAYDSTFGMYLSRDCSLEKLGADITYEPLAFGVPKGSPMKADIEKVMKSLLESGLLQEWWGKWSNRSSDTCDHTHKGKTASRISLHQIGGGLAIVCSGVLFAGVVLALEIAVHRYKREKTTTYK